MGKRMESDRIVKEAEEIVNAWPEDKRESILFLIALMSSNAKKDTGHGLSFEECFSIMVKFFRQRYGSDLTVSECLELGAEAWARFGKEV